MDRDDISLGMGIIEVAGKTALSTIPIGGPLIAAVFDCVKNNVFQKRLDKWKAMVEERLAKLEIDIETFKDNNTFATMLIKATELAIKTEQEEKLQYLANALVNSAEHVLDEDRLIIFMSFVEKHTTTHIKILNYFYDPNRFAPNPMNIIMGAPIQLLYRKYPECRELGDKCINDLYNDGLLNTSTLNATMTGQGMVAKRTTNLADEYLKFLKLV